VELVLHMGDEGEESCKSAASEETCKYSSTEAVAGLRYTVDW